MKSKLGLASLFFSSALFAAAFSSKSSKAAKPYGPPPPPAPSRLPFPTTPTAPTEPPKPRATPETFKVQALHRYEVVADVLPVKGVGLTTAATKILDSLRLDDPSLKNYRTVDRAGVGEVTRVTFQVNSLINNEFPIDRQLSTAGVGSVWVVSIKDITR